MFFRPEHRAEDDEIRKEMDERHPSLHALEVAPETFRWRLAEEIGKKPHSDKRGERPIKKEEYVEMLSKVLEVDLELLDSLAKVNKSVLKLLYERLSDES